MDQAPISRVPGTRPWCLPLGMHMGPGLCIARLVHMLLKFHNACGGHIHMPKGVQLLLVWGAVVELF